MRVLMLPLLLLLAWQLATGLGLVSAYLLPSPSSVLRTAGDMIESGVLARHMAASLGRVARGFSLSVAAGCALAAGLAHLPRLEKALDPVLSFMRMTPPLATIPLLILWFGIGEATQVVIIILASFFPVYLNARAGFARLDAPFRELAATLSLSRLDYARYFALPAALPSIITGVRLSFGYSWRALIAAELIAAGSGLGYMISDAEQMQRVDVVMVGIFAIGLVGWALDALFRRIVAGLLGRRFPEVSAA
ncbi:MAG: ABC transporter permease [Desulfovibrionaceae bacterium]|nr:ABC transporter permease [Desulfovibrionaceae bacterium]